MEGINTMMDCCLPGLVVRNFLTVFLLHIGIVTRENQNHHPGPPPQQTPVTKQPNLLLPFPSSPARVTLTAVTMATEVALLHLPCLVHISKTLQEQFWVGKATVAVGFAVCPCRGFREPSRGVQQGVPLHPTVQIQVPPFPLPWQL